MPTKNRESQSVSLPSPEQAMQQVRLRAEKIKALTPALHALFRKHMNAPNNSVQYGDYLVEAKVTQPEENGGVRYIIKVQKSDGTPGMNRSEGYGYQLVGMKYEVQFCLDPLGNLIRLREYYPHVSEQNGKSRAGYSGPGWKDNAIERSEVMKPEVAALIGRDSLVADLEKLLKLAKTSATDD